MLHGKKNLLLLLLCSLHLHAEQHIFCTVFNKIPCGLGVPATEITADRETITLIVLNLSHKNITTLCPFPCLCARPDDITVIQLNNNLISTICTHAFSPFKFVRRINLSFNNISSIERDAFDELIYLEELNLSANKLAYLNTADLIKIDGLKLLTLKDNYLAVIQDYSFAQLPKVTTLDLERNLLTTITTFMFAGMISLKTLVINQNNLTKIEPNAFADLQQVTSILLADNNLTDDSFNSAVFMNLKNLLTIDLRGNPLSESFVDTLRNELFPVEVLF